MKITGIKKAVSEIKNNCHMHHIVYLDRSTGKVWADFYADGNSWTQYYGTAIVNLKNYVIWDDITLSPTAIYTNAARRAMAEYSKW